MSAFLSLWALEAAVLVGFALIIVLIALMISAVDLGAAAESKETIKIAGLMALAGILFPLTVLLLLGLAGRGIYRIVKS